ncbi:MAG: thiol:disulfide interchange protein [Gallionellales bacterium 35-53-114]|jgi:cytochrome c biogenesis protein CcmG/thiol:disulfide interchange protein DsbE|nr:MAG: thiol:disulfide interchange protein [Gallionellales bacterium 35-53-114]OYZ65181.1 MAG: thiol:disulfide interchange protein [Gallionellales bacterium 24-53-125]OZB08088.1 MAG: thiol:disulfide interchange protein [Gallionellales bacterium 39-52-133]HQS58007.1 DsbE family thiol:disulfide interchange protein [Gallionellaceae bacterium]HQS73563.1 DsbE family thiol:disulfide interchange protein [Gallionellaceae bacterium]
MMRFILPFVIFIILATFLFVGLNLNPREVPSPLVGKAAPAFSLPQLHTPNRQFSPLEMEGKVWLLNVWASWCVSCEAEHPLLIELARQNIVPIVGLDYKDKRQAALVWLERRGNPYVLTVSDVEGRTGIDYGVYGVPETYVIDKQGLIQYKQIGPVTTENLRDKILPLVAELEKK